MTILWFGSGSIYAIGLQTAAGAIVTATHKNGIEYENIAFLVVSLEIITPMQWRSDDDL